MKKLTSNTPAIKAPIYANPELKAQAQQVDSSQDIIPHSNRRSFSSGYGFKLGVDIYIEDKPVFGDELDENQKQVIVSWPAFKNQIQEDWPLYLQVIRRQGERSTYSWLNLNRLTDKSYVDLSYPDDFRRIMTECYANDFERVEALRGCVIRPVEPTTIRSFKFGPNRGEILLDENGQRMTELVDATIVECSLKKLTAEESKVYRL